MKTEYSSFVSKYLTRLGKTIVFSVLCAASLLMVGIQYFHSKRSDSNMLVYKSNSGKNVYISQLLNKNFSFACVIGPYEDYEYLKPSAKKIEKSIKGATELVSEGRWELIAFNEIGEAVEKLDFDRNIINFCQIESLKCAGEKSFFEITKDKTNVANLQACLGE